MEENTTSINQRIAKNLIRYRKEAGLTQAELAAKINYSDKSVSKWELGNGVPDVYILLELAELYGITVNDLLSSETSVERKKDDKRGLHILIMLLSSGIVWLVATCLFVPLAILEPAHFSAWLVFVYAVVVNAIVCIVFAGIWRYKFVNFFSISLLIWSTLASLYLTILMISKSYGQSVGSFWLIFLLGVPLQVLITLWSFFRYKVFQRRENGEKKPKKVE
ncbi:MAG: helix-turn-helix domain-containing protein [Clostridia bacterium]|nr:helix-turn-helix domain-containing protein [Clostridia bacterium]